MMMKINSLSWNNVHQNEFLNPCAWKVGHIIQNNNNLLGHIEIKLNFLEPQLLIIFNGGHIKVDSVLHENDSFV